MRVRSLITTLCFGLLAALAIGCGGLGKSLESRAADYYNFMAGHKPGKKMSSFISPARKRDFDEENLAKLNEQGGGVAIEGTQKAEHGHIRAVELDGFAYTIVDPALGAPFNRMQPKRWVRDGRQWYAFQGSTSEVEAYGAFPAGLIPPDWEALEAAAKEAEEQAAADAAPGIPGDDTAPAPDE